MLAIAAAEYILRVVPPGARLGRESVLSGTTNSNYLLRTGTHEWDKFVDPDDIIRVLKQARWASVLLKHDQNANLLFYLQLQEGLEMKDLSGIIGDPITRNWRIHPTCTQVNYILCAAKPN